ncbi:MAG TPA: hypothetical protein VE035_09910 [Puia sp.]|nr:hypothetical protein [Puia sp.]
MKKLLIILFSVGLALGASAQRGHFGGGYHGGYVSRPHVAIGVGLGFGYSPFYPYYGYPYGVYGPWGYPYPAYYYGHGPIPSKLALQIEDIKNDYDARISDVRHDKDLPGKERRQQIRQLKHDRDQAIIQARRDYYYNSHRNPNNNNNNNQQRNNNNDQQKSSSDNQQEYNDNSGNGQ